MVQAAVKPNLFAEMTRFIESQIASGVYRPGDRLPPLRTWCDRFQVNLDTVRRGMWHLRDRGFVECRRGSGVYVRDFSDKAAKPCIGLVFATDDPAQSYCAHVLLGIRQQAQRERLSLLAYPASPGRAQLPQLNELQSAILLGNYDTRNADLSWLRRPAVGVEMHRMYGGLLSVVTMDPVNAAELAADYFLKHGKKVVRVLELSTPLHRFRAQVFANVFHDRGGKAEFVNDAAQPERFMDNDCGYLFTGGMCFEKLAQEFSGDLAHERCVISLDGRSEILPGHRPVTTITPDWRQIGVLALEEAVRRGRTPGNMGKRIYADVKLIER